MQNFGPKGIITTEARRTQRKSFVCREIPTNKNVLCFDMYVGCIIMKLRSELGREIKEFIGG
jgi:hypothetical protein